MKYKIVDIDKSDAYYESKDAIIGAIVELDGFGKFIDSNGWWRGSATYLGNKPIVYIYEGQEVVYKKGEAFVFHKVKLKQVRAKKNNA